MRLFTSVVTTACAAALVVISSPAQAAPIPAAVPAGPAAASTAATADSRGIEMPAFYTPPASVPSAPGQLIRSEPMPLSVNLPVIFPGKSTRIMYSSTDSNGVATAVTGAYIEPTRAWNGPGSRPLVGVAVGTIGQGDQCAPSYGLEHPIVWGIGTDGATFGVNYEIIQMSALLNSGYGVVVTDYIGLGTPGRAHTYVNRADQGQALLDAVRATHKLTGTSIKSDSRVGLWGYSQGGGAVASAAELHPTYAPDVNLVGSYAGAPPADLGATIKGIEGNLIAGVAGYTLNGLLESYPQLKPILGANLNAQGAAALKAVSTQCIVDSIASYRLAKSSDWTNDGRSLTQIVESTPVVKAIVDEQKIGNRKPTTPVLVTTKLSDGTVPHKQARQLAVDWCAKGSKVTYAPLGLPALPGDTDRLAVQHLTGLFEGLPVAQSWMADRLEGKSATTNCGLVPWLS